MKETQTPQPIENEEELNLFNWPDICEKTPAQNLKVDLTDRLIFPAPPERIAATYQIPKDFTAWGWSVKKQSWDNLIEFGGFLPQYQYFTFLPSAGLSTTSLNVIIFFELFKTPEEVLKAFPDNTREIPREKSIVDDLNTAPRININTCTQVKNIPLWEDGMALVEITVPINLTFNQAQSQLNPGRKAARTLAEARARRKLAYKVSMTVANTTCPAACNLATGKPGTVTSRLTHDRMDNVIADNQNMTVDWYSRHVAHCTVELKCRGGF